MQNANTDDGKKRALIISISEYDDELLPHLEFCKNDGNEMSKLLKSLGYEIKEEHNLIGKVSREQIEKAVDTFFTDDGIRLKDLLLFYYSGHGIPEANGDHYISSSEIDSSHPWSKGYSFDELAKMIDRSNSERKVVVLDCCYSGSAKLGKGPEDNSAVGREAVDNKIKAGYGKCILAACRGAQESFGRVEEDYSQFTYYLLEGLRGGNGESVDEKGNVTPEELSNYVIEKLDSLPPNKKPKQRPIRKIEASGEIILANYPSFIRQPSQIIRSDVEPNPPNPNKGRSWKLMIMQIEEWMDPIISNLSQEKLMDIKENMEQGKFFFYALNFEKAIEFCDKILAMEPKYIPALYNKGISLHGLGKYKQAISCYDKVLEIDSKNVPALLSKADSLSWRIGKTKETVECYDKVLEIDPKNSLALRAKGMTLSLSLWKKKEGIDCFDKALEIDPEDIDALNCKGSVLRDMGKKDESLECYDKVLKIDPKNVAALIGKGLTLDSLEKYNEAISCYDKVLEIDSKNVYALNQKGVTLHHFGKHKEAILCYDKVLEIDPKNFSALQNKKEMRPWIVKFFSP